MLLRLLPHLPLLSLLAALRPLRHRPSHSRLAATNAEFRLELATIPGARPRTSQFYVRPVFPSMTLFGAAVSPPILPRFLPLPVPLPTATGTLRGVLLPGRVTFGGRLSGYFNQGILTRLMCAPLFRGVGQNISTFGRLPGFGPKVYHYD